MDLFFNLHIHCAKVAIKESPSKNGTDYERMIHGVVKKCYINDKPFNTQKEKEY